MEKVLLGPINNFNGQIAIIKIMNKVKQWQDNQFDPLRPIDNFAESLTQIKTVFCLQRQNKASNPNRPHIILKAEIVSFNVISTRFDSL